MPQTLTIDTLAQPRAARESRLQVLVSLTFDEPRPLHDGERREVLNHLKDALTRQMDNGQLSPDDLTTAQIELTCLPTAPVATLPHGIQPTILSVDQAEGGVLLRLTVPETGVVLASIALTYEAFAGAVLGGSAPSFSSITPSTPGAC